MKMKLEMAAAEIGEEKGYCRTYIFELGICWVVEWTGCGRMDGWENAHWPKV